MMRERSGGKDELNRATEDVGRIAEKPVEHARR